MRTLFSPKARKVSTFIFLYIATGFIVLSTVWWTPGQQEIDYPLFRLLIITFATILLSKYFFYMTISPWYDVVTAYERKLHAEKNKPPYLPFVSVVIPAWNEEVGLVKTVSSVLGSDYENMEVVVINDGSTDASDQKMRAFIKKYELENRDNENRKGIIYKYKQNGGKGRALNSGIRLSSGDIIISIDADCILPPYTIGNFVRHFENERVMAAVGNVKIANQKSLLETLQYLEFLFSFYFKKADSVVNTIYIIGGAAGAFRRKVFEEVGLYSSENITEDIDLSVRIQEAGMKIVYAADAIVYTEAAATFKGLVSQRLRWKRGRFQTFYAHKSLFFSEKEDHSKLLSWLILPLALFGDLQLFFELFFLLFLYVYSYLTHDFSSFISGIIVVSSMFFVQIWDDKNLRRGSAASLYFLAPIGWLLFYVTTLVEYLALMKSILGIAARKDLTWQKWERVGISVNTKEA